MAVRWRAMNADLPRRVSKATGPCVRHGASLVATWCPVTLGDGVHRAITTRRSTTEAENGQKGHQKVQGQSYGACAHDLCLSRMRRAPLCRGRRSSDVVKALRDIVKEPSAN